MIEGRSAVDRLLKRGSIYALATAAQLLSGLLIIPIVTRTLEADEFGSVALSLVVVQLLAVLSAGGLPSSITVLYFKNNGVERARTLITLTVAFSTVTIMIVAATGPLWARLIGDAGYTSELRIATACAIPLATIAATQAFQRAQDRAVPFVVTAVAATLASQGLGLALLLVFDTGPAGYLAGLGIGYLVAASYGLLIARPTRRTIDGPPFIKKAFQLGAPTVSHGLSAFVLSAGDRIVVERFENLDGVGRYQVAYVVGTLGLTLALAANNSWAPLVLGTDSLRRLAVLAETTAALQRLAAIVAGGLAIAAPIALQLAAPASYDPSSLARVSGILALTGVIHVVYLSRVIILFDHQTTATLGWATPTVAIFNLALNMLLVPLWSLTGAAIATVAAYALLALLVARSAARQVKVDWENREAVKSWITGLVLVALGLVLPVDALVTRFLIGCLLLGALGWNIRFVLQRAQA